MLTTLRYFTALACVAESRPAAKLLVIRTANGTEETLKFVECRPYQPNRSVASPDLSA
jgi:hypothetical protein